MGFHVDLRLTDGLAGRKRYVLFTRSAEVLDHIANYFERVPLAPTEVTSRRQQEGGAQSAG